MALETASFINGLVVTNPTGSDPKSSADDHLRLTKSALKNSFTGITGAVTVTHLELNSVVERGRIDGQTWTGNHTFPATVYGVTAPFGASGTALATLDFVNNVATSAALPGQDGNAGKALFTDGLISTWQFAPSFTRIAVITATGSWTPPANCIRAKVTVIGGGASCSTGVSSQQGGAGGGGAIKVLTVDPAITYTAAIGAGGAAVMTESTPGNSGSTSSFSGAGIATISATGGAGSAANNQAGIGGIGSGGDLNIRGGVGLAAFNGLNGVGGASIISGQAQPGTAGNPYGGGSGSAHNISSGWAGADGVIIIEY